MTAIDVQPYEETALDYASEQGGEYLESIGKTDLAALEPEEWQQFIKIVGFAFLMKRIELMPVPF